jgi:hypothetical protein
LPKNSPGLAKKFATAGEKIRFGWWRKKIPPTLVEQLQLSVEKIHQGCRKNPPCLAEISLWREMTSYAL